MGHRGTGRHNVRFYRGGLSRHKSSTSFPDTLGPVNAGNSLGSCIATDQHIESVGLFLASFAGMKGIVGTQGTADEKGKSLEKQKIAVS